jgi:hypothetical protein
VAMSSSGSLTTPSRLEMLPTSESVATARESVLDVSSLKAKSERKGIEESGLLGRHKEGSQ